MYEKQKYQDHTVIEQISLNEKTVKYNDEMHILFFVVILDSRCFISGSKGRGTAR